MSRVVFVAAPLSQLRQHFLQRLQRQQHGTAELDETGACLRRVLRVPGQPILGGALIITRVIPAVALSRKQRPTQNGCSDSARDERGGEGAEEKRNLCENVERERFSNTSPSFRFSRYARLRLTAFRALSRDSRCVFVRAIRGPFFGNSPP